MSLVVNRRELIVAAAVLAALPARAAPLGYAIRPQAVADGLWIVRGADAPILAANGGAIANTAIIATPAGTVLFDCGPSLRYGQALKAVSEGLTGRPVVRVYLSHLHPDHVFGAGAFDPAIVAATPAAIAALDRDKAGFADAMYRILGDWMRGTDPMLPGHVLAGEAEDFDGRRLRLLPLAGHSASDLAILDEASGTLIAGDLVFHDRAPATPHADLAIWQASLDRLAALGHARVIPGHGPLDPGPEAAIAQTRDWIGWLPGALQDSLARGMDMAQAGTLGLPPRFATMAAARIEYQRSIAHFWPALEARQLPIVGGRI